MLPLTIHDPFANLEMSDHTLSGLVIMSSMFQSVSRKKAGTHSDGFVFLPFSWNWNGRKFWGGKKKRDEINVLIAARPCGQFVSYLVHSFYVPLWMILWIYIKIGHSHRQILTAEIWLAVQLKYQQSFARITDCTFKSLARNVLPDNSWQRYLFGSRPDLL